LPTVGRRWPCSKRIDDLFGVASTWDSLGHAHQQLGRYRRATICYRHAVEHFRTNGDRYGEAISLDHTADAYATAGDHDAARRNWHDALRIFDQIDHPDADRVRAKLAQHTTPTRT
jgi:tetratricopeptide (TPR) repeat protein